MLERPKAERAALLGFEYTGPHCLARLQAARFRRAKKKQSSSGWWFFRGGVFVASFSVVLARVAKR